MAQNTSHAVMQQRHEAHDSLDDFPTPPWATRALCEHVIGRRQDPSSQSVWEPACNRGYMAKPLAEYFRHVHTSDIHSYGWEGQQDVRDFLFPGEAPRPDLDWIITNPPFRLASQFVERALSITNQCAVLVRTAFLESATRYSGLFYVDPPSVIAQFVERVPMVKGRHDPEASTATAYAWLVWFKDREPPRADMVTSVFQWIPPCRSKLQKPTDA